MICHIQYENITVKRQSKIQNDPKLVRQRTHQIQIC